MSDAELNTLASRADATTGVTQIDASAYIPDYPEIHRACQRGDCKRIQEILDEDPNALNDAAPDGTFPLHVAASNNWMQACCLLISRGAAVNVRGGAMRATPLMWACRNGMVYIVKTLIEGGAHFEGIHDESGFSPLHLAVHSSNVLMVIYLVHLDVTLDTQDQCLRTPLHWAIVQGDHMSVESLLRAGANPHLPDGDGRSPLALAVSGGHLDILRLLLLFGADPVLAAAQVRDCGADLLWTKTIEQYYPARHRFANILLTPKVAAFLTTLVGILHVVSIPVFMKFLTPWIGLPVASASIYYGTKWLTKIVIPIKWPGDSGLVRSTYLPGIFIGVAFMDYFLYLCRILPYLFHSSPIVCVVTSVLIATLPYLYLKCVFMDPGFILQGSVADRLRDINRLIDLGMYDSRYFCVHTYVPMPVRSCYDHFTELVVARFDHYCPWVYNAVGVRNHRVFYLFITMTSVSLVLVGYQYILYIKSLTGVTFMSQLKDSIFSIYLIVLNCANGAWLLLLVFVQSVQITTAFTSREISSRRFVGNKEIFSSIPYDHPQYVPDYGATEHPSKNMHAHKARDPFILRLFGIQQVTALYKNISRGSRNRFDNGPVRNCNDFWYGGGSCFSPDEGYGMIGGETTNYYDFFDRYGRK